jgi:hypothetical protein
MTGATLYILTLRIRSTIKSKYIVLMALAQLVQYSGNFMAQYTGNFMAQYPGNFMTQYPCNFIAYHMNTIINILLWRFSKL